MDTFYISHGAPTLSIDESLPARHFLKAWQDRCLCQRSTSILVVSGHWEATVPTVNVIAGRNKTIHDFYNFPEQMYKLKSSRTARKVKELLMASGFEHVEEDKTRGLDHGAWVPLILMYPEADIPVCQLSVQPNRDGSYHYNLRKALAPLKEEGVLIMGSGSATHNLRAPRNCPTPPWALDFDTWLKDALLEGRYKDVNQREEKAPCAKMAHPWPDHLYPLHVAVGAAGENAKAKLIHHSWHKGGSLSYASYQFTSATV